MRSKDPGKMKDILNFIKDYMIENHLQPTVAIIAEEFRNSTSTIHAYLKEMNEKDMLKYKDGRIELPMDGKIGYQENSAVLLKNTASYVAGAPEDMNIQSYINLPAILFPESNLVIITAKDDSMEDAGISENDLLFIETTNPPKKGEIVVALDDDGNTLIRRLQGFHRGVPLLSCQNQAKYSKNLRDKRIVEIQGVVKHILKHC